MTPPKLHLRNNRLCGFSWGLVARVISQQIHGRTGVLIPVGGRQIISLAFTINVLKSASSSMRIGDLRGIKRQTAVAKGHWKKTCIAVDINRSYQVKYANRFVRTHC
ncbi:hypothetical protein IGI04_021519 [Brassica rapa subsp. trilocularis]|uniref:Uncharacterized protein n=1 Tax=Brassica rapa subsp. trilocularis TaxID=1813537 RepID=A0ABQ7M0R1_BRACM|nr:hypothetical protein IGI04_021519 [Brassica rapa subsp. trilocularis]